MRWIGRFTEYLLYVFFASLVFSNTLAQGVAIILIVLWIIRWITGRYLTRYPLDLAVLLYLLIRSITCFTSIEPATSFLELRSGVFFSFIYFVITQHLAKDREEKEIYRYLALLIYAGAIAAVYGVGYVIVHQFAVRAQSTAGGISRFSAYTMIAFCLAFALPGQKRIFPRKWLAYLVIGLLGMGLIFARARAQWIAIVPLVFFIGLRRERWLLAFFTGLFGFFVLAVRQIRQRIGTFFCIPAAIEQRLLIWKGAREVFFRRPLLGFGPRTYRIVSPYLKDRGSWHSDYLQAYLDSGIFGFLSYLHLSVMLFYHSIRIIRNPLRREIGWAFLLTFVALYIVSFVGGHIQEPVITPLFFSLIAFVSVLSKEGSKS
jgi:O-antigen ligase